MIQVSRLQSLSTLEIHAATSRLYSSHHPQTPMVIAICIHIPILKAVRMISRWTQSRCSYVCAILDAWTLQKVLSLEKVQQDILSWDLGKVTGRFSSDRLEKLPDTFDNLEHYTHTFWRLMHEELRAHIQQVAQASYTSLG